MCKAFHPTHFVSPTCTDTSTSHTIVHIQILMGSTLYETTEPALIDSLGLFSIKKIPFGVEESLRGENRNKEKIQRWVNKK